jgi:biopolymer transport protein ExbD
MSRKISLQFNYSSENELLNEINTTPLVDVMLVLLIIFLITIPVVSSSVDVNLPRENNKLRNVNVGSVVVSALRSGEIITGNRTFDLNKDNNFADHIKEIAALQPQPEIHIRADKEMVFQNLGRLLKLLQNCGIQRIAFLTEPSSDL